MVTIAGLWLFVITFMLNELIDEMHLFFNYKIFGKFFLFN
jgi:hypothetical protein